MRLTPRDRDYEDRRLVMRGVVFILIFVFFLAMVAASICPHH